MVDYLETLRSYGNRQPAANEAVILSAMGSAQPSGGSPDPNPNPQPGITAVGQMGYNMTEDDYAAPSFTYLNRMKTSGDGGKRPWNNNSPLDQYGYPTALGSGSDTSTLLSFRKSTTPVRYRVMHNGTNVTGPAGYIGGISGLTVIDASNPNNVLIELAAGEPQSGRIVVTGASVWPTYKPNATGLKDGWAVVEERYVSRYLAGEIFYPEWLAELAEQTQGRVMDWERINGGNTLTSANFTPVGYSTYGPNGLPVNYGGTPIEVIVRAFNEAKALPGSNIQSMWFCIPSKSNTATNRLILEYIRDNLNPAIKLILEYGNEMWNQQFAGYQYCLDNSANGDPAEGFGFLSAKMVELARDVFGASYAARVYPVMMRQTGAPNTFTGAETGTRRAGYELRDLYWAGGGASYISGGFQPPYVDNSAARAKILSIVTQWESDGIIPQAAIDQMRDGNGYAEIANTNTRTEMLAQRAVHAAFWRSRGVPHDVSYELQNWHTTVDSYGAVDGARISRFMSAMANDPRVSGLAASSFMSFQYKAMRDMGITMPVVLCDYGILSQYGNWATKPSAVAANTNLWNFYKNWQTNASLVLFEIDIIGSLSIALGQTITRRVTRFGGVFPSGPVRMISAPSGVTFSNGVLTFSSATAAGTATVVLGCRDASGREITKSVDFNVTAQTGYRFFRFTPAQNFSGDTPTDNFYRVGSDEFAFFNGSTMIPPDTNLWTATCDTPSGSNPPSRLVDGLFGSPWATVGTNGNGQAGVITIDFGEGYLQRPSSVDIYACTVASGFSINRMGKIEVSNNGTSWTTIVTNLLLAYSARGQYQAANIPLTYP